MPFFFSSRGPALNAVVGAEVPDPMVDMFVKDIEEGIAGTGVKAGLLKCAIDHQGLTRGVERVMRAVAKAHRRTGVPITVHTHPGARTGLEVQRVLGEEGVDPRRVVLGHSGDSTDVEHLCELADAGFLLGFDRFGLHVGTTFEERAGTLVEMCRRGYAESIVLSQDAACYIDWIAPDVMPLLAEWHYTHVHDAVLPWIRERGVSEEQIETMLVTNPRHYFESNTGCY